MLLLELKAGGIGCYTRVAGLVGSKKEFGQPRQAGGGSLALSSAASGEVVAAKPAGLFALRVRGSRSCEARTTHRWVFLSESLGRACGGRTCCTNDFGDGRRDSVGANFSYGRKLLPARRACCAEPTWEPVSSWGWDGALRLWWWPLVQMPRPMLAAAGCCGCTAGLTQPCLLPAASVPVISMFCLPSV